MDGINDYLDYFDVNALSQSKIKNLLKGPKIGDKPKEGKALRTGSAIDSYVTDPAFFSEKYVIRPDVNEPTGQDKKIIEFLLIHSPDNSEFSEELMQEAYAYAEVKQRNLDKVKEDLTKYKEYIAFEFNARNKVVVSKEEHFNIVTRGKKIVKYLSSYDNEILYQLPIYFKFNDVDSKALLDVVVIDHINKVIRPIDIKTYDGYPGYDFIDARIYGNFRYDIQAFWYTQALKKQYPYYSILPFKFLVCSTKYDIDLVEFDIKRFRDNTIADTFRGVELYQYYETYGYEDVIFKTPIEVW